MTDPLPLPPLKVAPMPEDREEPCEPSTVSRVSSFATSCAINLLLPFINGLMLGFGELLAHEICWRKSIFPRSNHGYQIYPESRKFL
ncbi:MIM1 (YOL026C) [Zygosaccharomyces parabailii]|nr:MIM1 (YOL026C) [Zygosaccharomyces parabailii]